MCRVSHPVADDQPASSFHALLPGKREAVVPLRTHSRSTHEIEKRDNGRQPIRKSRANRPRIPPLPPRHFVSHLDAILYLLGSIGALANIAPWPTKVLLRMVGTVRGSSPKKDKTGSCSPVTLLDNSGGAGR